MKNTLLSVTFALAAATLSAGAETPQDESELPMHSIVLKGDSHQLHQSVMNALLDTRDFHFQDPGVPRYLLIDKEGKTALGIGGYVEGIATADFRGSISSYDFITYDIPVPSTPAQRSRLGADLSHTTIFLKLVRYTKLGVLNAYVQTMFNGDGGALTLHKAYVSLGNVTMGLTNTTFSDPSAAPPTVDYQGPAGQIGSRNIQLRYRLDFARSWTFAVAAELPKMSITSPDDKAQKLNQSLPDIPVYMQYSWGTGSHVRASALLRNLSYRDIVDGRNRHKTGYGVQISGIFDVRKKIDIFYQGAYGRGIAHFVNDLDGAGFDLVASDTQPGRMTAPRTVSVVAGAQYNITPDLFLSASYSFNRLYDQTHLGPDTYRRANYVAANAFYSPISDLQLGIEYLHGTRRNVDNTSACANRVELMVKYSF